MLIEFIRIGDVTESMKFLADIDYMGRLDMFQNPFLYLHQHKTFSYPSLSDEYNHRSSIQTGNDVIEVKGAINDFHFLNFVQIYKLYFAKTIKSNEKQNINMYL